MNARVICTKMSEPVVLTSPANPTVKHLVRMRDNRARRRASRVVVDGWRETAQALAAGFRLCGLYCAWSDQRVARLKASDRHRPDAFAKAGLSSGGKDASENDWESLALASGQVDGRITWVTESIMQKISYGDSSRGVVAEFERPDCNLDQLKIKSHPLILVLDRIEKPGNVGAVFRSADAAGVDAVLLCDGGDPLHPNAIRSSSGGVFHVPWACAGESEIASFLTSNRIEPIAARVESSKSMWEVEWPESVAIFLGNEAEGLADRWLALGQDPIVGVHVPMSGRVDSLNISVAASLLSFVAAQARRSR